MAAASESCALPDVVLQGNLLLLVQRLMHGGSLQLALQQAGKREALRWGARWEAGYMGQGRRFEGGGEAWSPPAALRS